MPAVSKKQQRFFGYLLSNPDERKKRGISKKAAKDFAQDIQEVSPPGWGHTKAEKEKTKPWKPKSKIGGSAAAFKRDLDSGKFKGLPGDKTKKEKTASMFKIMWAAKKKGYKPHYKPGTDKKYKKYQEEERLPLGQYKDPIHYALVTDKKVTKMLNTDKKKKVKEDWKPEIEVVDTKARAKKAEKKRKEAESSLPPHLKLDVMKKAFASTNESVMPNVDPKDRKVIKARAKNLFKKDLKGEVQGVNEMKVSRLKDNKGAASKVIDAMISAARRDREAREKQKEKKRPKAPYQILAQEYVPEGISKDYEQLKKKIGSKEKHSKPVKIKTSLTTSSEDEFVDNIIGESTELKGYQRFMADIQAAKDRQKKKEEDRKKKTAQYMDTKKKGVKFYDKKGSGRIVKGKKVYN